MIRGTCEIKTRHFSLKAGREKLFVILDLDGTILLNVITKEMDVECVYLAQ